MRTGPVRPRPGDAAALGGRVGEPGLKADRGQSGEGLKLNRLRSGPTPPPAVGRRRGRPRFEPARLCPQLREDPKPSCKADCNRLVVFGISPLQSRGSGHDPTGLAPNPEVPAGRFQTGLARRRHGSHLKRGWVVVLQPDLAELPTIPHDLFRCPQPSSLIKVKKARKWSPLVGQLSNHTTPPLAPECRVDRPPVRFRTARITGRFCNPAQCGLGVDRTVWLCL